MEKMRRLKVISAAGLTLIAASCFSAPHKEIEPKPKAPFIATPTTAVDIGSVLLNCLEDRVFAFTDSPETRLAAKLPVNVAMGFTYTQTIVNPDTGRTETDSMVNPGIEDCPLPDGRDAKLLYAAQELRSPLDYNGHKLTMDVDDIGVLIFDRKGNYSVYDPAKKVSLSWSSSALQHSFTTSYNGQLVEPETTIDPNDSTKLDVVTQLHDQELPIMHWTQTEAGAVIAA